MSRSRRLISRYLVSPKWSVLQVGYPNANLASIPVVTICHRGAFPEYFARRALLRLGFIGGYSVNHMWELVHPERHTFLGTRFYRNRAVKETGFETVDASESSVVARDIGDIAFRHFVFPYEGRDAPGEELFMTDPKLPVGVRGMSGTTRFYVMRDSSWDLFLVPRLACEAVNWKHERAWRTKSGYAVTGNDYSITGNFIVPIRRQIDAVRSAVKTLCLSGPGGQRLAPSVYDLSLLPEDSDTDESRRTNKGCGEDLDILW